MSTHLTPQECADQAAEAIRALNHATIGHRAGYVCASDVDATIGALHTTIYGLGQALSQMQRWLFTADDAGRIGHDEHREPGAGSVAVEDLSTDLLQAAAHADALARSLARMQSVSTHLTTVLDDEEAELPA